MNTPNRLSVGLILLLVSVALNGLLAGLVLANKTAPLPTPIALHENSEHAPRPNMHLSINPHRVLRGLSQERRAAVLAGALEDIDGPLRKNMRGLRMNLAAANQALTKAAMADPFNAQAFSQALDDLGSAREALGRGGDQLLMKIWARLTPEERQAAIAERQSRRINRRKRNPEN